jgi:rhodanese-related sulfurtransferase
MTAKTIPINECRRLLENGRALHIVDVRTPGEFARVHATGARLMPLDELNPQAIAAQRPAAGDSVYVICHSGKRAAKACEHLLNAGLPNVYAIEGGTEAWEASGLPVERGTSRVISLERQVRIVAGSLVLAGAILAWLVHPAFVGLSAFVGAGLVFAGVTDYCGMAMLLAKMPWNRTAPAGSAREAHCSPR